MKKKADMSIQTVVIAVLALMVLVVVLFIFWKNVGGAGTQFNWFRTHTGEEYCMSAGFTRQCISGECSSLNKNDVSWTTVSPPVICDKDDKGNCKSGTTQNAFRDCSESSNCCERTS